METAIKILIVEDERIVAEDIENSIRLQGYDVTGVVSSGEAAIASVAQNRPDLIMMDIVIDGPLTGIQTSEKIKNDYGLPVIFLTAYADETTLEKAKLTEPFGYIVKPFNDKDLKSTIEMALFRHSMQKKLRESETWFSTTLLSLGDGIIATDQESRVTFINQAAAEMIGIDNATAVGLSLEHVFHVFREDGLPANDPVRHVLDTGEIIKQEHSSMITARHGRKIYIKYSAAPIHNAQDGVLGVVIILSDVTKERKVQEQLKNERDFSDTLLRTTPAFFIAVDAGGRTIMINAAVSALLGFEKEDVHGRDFFKTFIPAAEQAEMRELLERTDRTHQRAVSHENRMKTRDGKEVLVEWHGKPVFKNDRMLDFYFIMGMDITARRQTEEALRMSEERYRGLFETMGQGVIYFGVDGKIISCNPAAEKIFDMSMYAMIGRSVLDPCWGMIQEDGTPFKADTHPVMISLKQAQPVSKSVVGINTPAGKHSWLMLDARPVLHPGENRPVSVFSTFTDITPLRQIELKLARRNTQLNALNMIARGVSGTLDIKSIMDTALNEVLRLAGYTSGCLFIFSESRDIVEYSVVARLREWEKALLNRIVCNKAAACRSTLLRGSVRAWKLSELTAQNSLHQSGISGGETGDESESKYIITIPVREGNYIIGGVNLVGESDVLPDEMDMEFFINVGHHVGLAIRNGRLYGEANKALEKLQVAQDKLVESEKLAGLGALASNVVHEIGNPLAAISNSVQVLQGRVVLEGKMKELMDIIGWETERLERSVNELREFSRPKKYNFVPCDIREVVKKAILLLSQDLELVLGRKILKSFSGRLCDVILDADAMEQVVINLIKNGLQAVPEGGVVKVLLRMKGPLESQSVVLEVKDNGPGIALADQKQIFEPYFTTKARGMGLGMHIIRENIKAHKGKLEIISIPGKGTTMRVILPVTEAGNG